MSLSSWSCLSVQQFFERFSWQGEPLKTSPQAVSIATDEVTHSTKALALGDSSWSCISVSDFLDLCNWEAKPIQEESLSVSPEVKGIIFGSSWSSLSVSEFLDLANWEGKQPQAGFVEETERDVFDFLEPEAIEETFIEISLESSWLGLTVQQFFEGSNWHGQPRKQRQAIHRDASVSLNLSVGEFFDHLSWEGKPEIGVLPEAEPTLEERFTAVEKEPTITDLSDLF